MKSTVLISNDPIHRPSILDDYFQVLLQVELLFDRQGIFVSRMRAMSSLCSRA